MPVRNGAAFLGAAVESILAQSMPDWELIAVDDGSTDATLSMLQGFAAADGRITVKSSGGAGIVPALNLGIAAARAELIARMDADDIAMPSRLERQAAFMEANPGLAAAGSQAIKMDSYGKQTGLIDVPSGEEEITDQLKRRNPFIHPTMMMRKSAFLHAGGYRTGCTYAEDYDLWLRLEETGSLANLAKPTLLFREHSAQTSRKKRLAQRAASALARQLALRRRSGRGEGVTLERSLDQCCADYLSMRAAETADIGAAEAKELAVMLRFVHVRLARQTVARLVGRLCGEGGLKKGWILRLRIAFGRVAARWFA